MQGCAGVVCGVHDTPSARQSSPGVSPPLGCVSTACALSIAVLTAGRAGANGGPRTVTIASRPPPTEIGSTPCLTKLVACAAVRG